MIAHSTKPAFGQRFDALGSIHETAPVTGGGFAFYRTGYGGALLLQSGGGLALNVSEAATIMSYPAPGFAQDMTIIDNRGFSNPAIAIDPVSVW